ncbi:MAG: TonB-dependent receptor [Cytophagales bacterium]|nr:TonB-dependent receptor [Cytophagales bacterium]
MNKLLPKRRLLEKVMRITIGQLLLSAIFLSVSYANEGKAQDYLEQKISLSAQNQPVEKILKQIENKSSVNFIYSSGLINANRKTSVNVKETELNKVLNELFTPLKIKYIISGKNVVLRPNTDQSSVQETAVDPQTIITGTVKDQNGEAVIGATIVVKGTTNGVSTNVDGSFELKNVNPEDYLVVSFIGYIKQEIAVGNKTKFDIILEEETSLLDEVIVVGYATMKKSDVTGAVSSLKPEEANKGANVSPDQIIQGRVSGVQVSQTSGEPGGGISIRIRGATSINASNEPLYVIDGFPIDNSSTLGSTNSEITAGVTGNLNPKNPLNSLNPNDIQSIEILKDASSTAIYGARGANGVVLITTKKGHDGKPKVNYDLISGIQLKPQGMDVLSTSEYINVTNAISQELNGSPTFSQSDIAAIGQGTDWQSLIFRPAPINSHNVSISGKSGKTGYFVSMNYFNQVGAVKNSGMGRFGTRLNLTQEITDKLNLTLNLNTTTINDQSNSDGINNNERSGPINTALAYDPTEMVYNEDGTFTQSPNITVNNPLSLLNGVDIDSKSNRTFGNLVLDYKIADFLDAKLNLGRDQTNVRRDIYNNTNTIFGRSANGIANVASLDLSNFLGEYTMNYHKTFNDNSLNILGGITYQNFLSRTFSGEIQGFPSDDLGTNNLNFGNTNNDGLSSNTVENTLLSYLSRVNYNIKNKYLLTASIRADGSSKFGANNKYGYFPSAAFGWRMSEDGILTETFNDLKLRLSWGLTGNQDIGNYNSISTLIPATEAVFNNSTSSSIAPSRIANPNLKWEVAEQYNAGLDFALLNSRINGSVDYFIKNTKDLLLNLPLPVSSGYSTILSNVGQMRNNGIELMINSTNINKNNLKWISSFNISSIKNKVTDLGELESIRVGNIEYVGNTGVIQPNEAVSSYYGYEITGIFQNAEEIKNSAQPNSKPGYPIFKDLNGDGRISPDDQRILGNPFPKVSLGLRNNIEYKNLSLDFFFYGALKQSLINVNVIEAMYPINFRRNRIAEIYLDRWTPENTDAKWPSGVSPSAYGGGMVNTLTVQDASYLRLKTVQLAYNVPLKTGKKIQSINLNLTGQNLWTITNYLGWDPEASAFGRNNMKLDYNAYPITKSIQLGANISF